MPAPRPSDLDLTLPLDVADDDVVDPHGLWQRLFEAIPGSAIRREETVDAVMRVLTEVADEWQDDADDYYYAHRHRGPIEYAGGFSDGWQHAASLLKGVDPSPPDRDW